MKESDKNCHIASYILHNMYYFDTMYIVGRTYKGDNGIWQQEKRN